MNQIIFILFRTPRITDGAMTVATGKERKN